MQEVQAGGSWEGVQGGGAGGECGLQQFPCSRMKLQLSTLLDDVGSELEEKKRLGGAIQALTAIMYQLGTPF